MTRLPISVCIAGLLPLFSTSAYAADIVHPPAHITSPVPLADNWTGFYAGVNGGLGKAQVVRGGVFAGYDSLEGISGGVQAGYNLKLGPAILGVEADVQAAHMSQSVNNATHNIEYFGTLRARAGFEVAGRFMPYVTAGIAGAGGRHELPASATSSKFHAGWTAGAGIEARLTNKISVKAEYLHLDLGREVYFPVANATTPDVGIRADIIRAGVNFRF